MRKLVKINGKEYKVIKETNAEELKVIEYYDKQIEMQRHIYVLHNLVVPYGTKGIITLSRNGSLLRVTEPLKEIDKSLRYYADTLEDGIIEVFPQFVEVL